MKHNVLRWLIYTRVSTDDQADRGVSLEAQESSCRAYAQARGWDVAEVITDAGYSGGTTRRPGYQRMTADLKARKFAGVIVWKLDRLTRSLRALLDVVDLAEEAEAGLISVTEALDTSTPAGRLMLHMLGSFGQHERETIAARVTAAMDHVRRQGYWTGGHVPPGCQVVEDGERKRLIPDPATEALIRPLWSRLLKGDSLTTLARDLHQAAVPAPGHVGRRAARGWTPTAVRNLIRSPQVTGVLVDPATQTAAIASLDRRDSPIKRAKATPALGSRATVASILAGLVRCPGCQSAMVQATVKNRHGTSYRYFRCSLANKNRALCPERDVRVESTEAAALRAIEDAVNGPAYREALEASLKTTEEAQKAAQEERTRLAGAREALEARIASLARMGTLGDRGFQIALESLGTDLAALDRQIAQVEGILAVGTVDNLNLVGALEAIRTAVERFTHHDVEPTEKAALIREWIHRIEIHPDLIVLDLYGFHLPKKNPQLGGRGFAHEVPIGTPTYAPCKPLTVRVEVPRVRIA